MSKIAYPRPCPTCGTKINNRFNFSRHKKYCGTDARVPCLHCEKTFCRKDKMVAHVRKCHLETTKRKAPRLNVDPQTGGAVSTRDTKREADQEQKPEVKLTKQGDGETSDEDTLDSYESRSNPLFVANVTKLGPAKRWKKNIVVNQKFIMTLDQQRPPKSMEDLNIAATFAIAGAVDKLIEELAIPDDYWMTLQIGSKEHRKEGLTGETWKIPVGDFAKRAQMTQELLAKIALVLNSAEFITRDVGFSASVLFSRPERKGGKRTGAGPGTKIWEKMVKESRSVCEIKNKDDLCCARALVVMREYAKRQAGEPNTFHNIYLDRGTNTQQLKEAKKLHKEANVPEGLCGLDEVNQFQEFLGPKGFRIIVVEAARGGVIFKGDKFEDERKTIALVKSVYVDESGRERAHYDGLYSIPGFMNRSYFCSKCCKGYEHEDSTHHRCQAKNCPACKRNTANDEEGCQDFSLWKKPDRSCRVCKREFYGERCFRAHLIESVEENRAMTKARVHLEQQLGERIPPLMDFKSTCRDFQRCEKCLVSYKVNHDFPHKCLHAQCKHCLEFVHIYEHKCFITSEQEKDLKRVIQKSKAEQRNREKLLEHFAVSCLELSTQNDVNHLISQRKKKLQDLRFINKSVPRSDTSTENVQEQIIAELFEEGFSAADITVEMVNGRLPEEAIPKTIDAENLIFADIECVIDESNTFTPILICYTKGRDKKIRHH